MPRRKVDGYIKNFKEEIQRFKKTGHIARFLIDVCERMRHIPHQEFTLYYAELLTTIFQEFPEDKLESFVISGFFRKGKK
jgi:hypothetical protein